MVTVRSLKEVWRRSVDLNIRYYGAIGRLTAAYVEDLIAGLTDLRASPSPLQPQPQAQSAGLSHAASPQPSVPIPLSPPEPRTTAAPSHQAGVMVLEGEAGGQALGVFLVANNLGYEVSARVAASAFLDANGRAVQPAFTFDPEVIVLAPAEQLLVRVMLPIDDSLEPEVRYRGEFTIPELSSTRIPIVLRRQLSPGTVPVEANSIASDSPKKTRLSGRAGSPRSKRAVSRGEQSGETKS